MVILQQPDAVSLSANLKTFIISSSAAVLFTLTQGGETILSQRYEPNQDSRIEIDLRDVIESRLYFELRDIGTVYVQPGIVSNFTATIGNVNHTFRVLRGGVDHLEGSTESYLRGNFLTWQPTVKRVTYYTPEFLTYYATGDCTAKLRAYFTDDAGNVTSQVDYEIASLSSGSATTLPLQYGNVVGWLDGRLPAWYDVWIEDGTGVRLTYIQRYVCDIQLSLDEDWFLFENSLGGIDTFRAYGDMELKAEHTHNVAMVEEDNVEYRIDTERIYHKNTGQLSKAEARWLLDYPPAKGKYIYLGNSLRRIVVTSSDLSGKLRTEPTSYSFSFKLADARPLLNVQREDVPAQMLNIVVPDLGNFTLPPRLAEFPDQPLSEGVLFPVQSPYSEKWGTTTVSALQERISAPIIDLIQRAAAGLYDDLASGLQSLKEELSDLNRTELDKAYIKVDYFNRLFRIYDGQTTVKANDLVNPIDGVESQYDFWSVRGISSLGRSSSPEGDSAPDSSSGFNEAAMWNALAASGSDKINASHLPLGSGLTVVNGLITASVGGGGSVTSVGLSVPTGLAVSNSPITSAGTIAVSLATGYVIPQESRFTAIERITSLFDIDSNGDVYVKNNRNFYSYGTVGSLGAASSSESSGFNEAAMWNALAESGSDKINASHLPLGSGLTVVNGLITSSVGGGGSVTSVGLTVPTGLAVSNSPITSAGTIAVSLATGYVIPQESRFTAIERITSLFDIDDNGDVYVKNNRNFYSYGTVGSLGAASSSESSGFSWSELTTADASKVIDISHIPSIPYSKITGAPSVAQQTVTLASGTNNGTLKLTVGSGVTDNIAVKGLAAAAYKGVVTTLDTSANLPTANAVRTALAGYLPATKNANGTYTVDLTKVIFTGTIVSEEDVVIYGTSSSSGGSGGSTTIIDNLTSTATDAALSANMGRYLKSLIDNIDVSQLDMSSYLPKSGGTLTGVLTMPANQYEDARNGALNMNNSDIYGANSIYFADAANGQAEGLHWYRSATAVDTMRVYNGSILFAPNRTLGEDATEYTVVHSGNINTYIPNLAASKITSGTFDVARIPSITVSKISDFSTHVYDATLSRTANTVLAAPNGSNGVATFRKLVAADIPSLSGSYVTLDTTQTITGTKTFSAAAVYIGEGTWINAEGGYGLLVYHPSGNSSISSLQWGVGAANSQGVIRSNANNLVHYRGGTNYNILDTYNAPHWTMWIYPESGSSGTFATNIASNTDLNNILDAGTYYCYSSNVAGTLSNTPYTAGNFRLWNIYNTGTNGASSGSWFSQLILAPNEGNLYIRSHSNNSFGAWHRFIKDNGGSMTGNLTFNANSLGVVCSNGTYSMKIMIGSGGSNRGIWDDNANEWTIYKNANNYTVLGKSYNVGIGTDSPTQKLHVSGNILATGDVLMYSDRRLKTNIRELEYRGDLKPYSYVKDDKADIGFIAQEVGALYPELVHSDDSPQRIQSLNYNGVLAVLYAGFLRLKHDFEAYKHSKSD